MHCKIRTAAAADVPAMHRIRTSVTENRLGDHSRITETCYLPYVAAGSAWVAQTSAGIAGFAILDGETNSVWALFVDQSAQGAGIGRALHDHMLDWARERGFSRLSLTTSPGTRAERFYKAVGWLQIGFTADGEARFEKHLAA
jgi:GNAT superfamily N-acetyltransferase